MSEFDTAPAAPEFERRKELIREIGQALDAQPELLERAERVSVLQAAVIKAARELEAAGAVTIRIDPDPDFYSDSYHVTFEVRPKGCSR